MEQRLTCTDNWLNETYNPTTMTTSGGTALAMTNGFVQVSNNVQWTYWPYYTPVYHVSEARPIKLTLSEVERLRKAARADDRLKAILGKFTRQIEITVDFD